ncbi:GTPase [Winogradskyella eckloniae]|uniref:GTPase n=1 Tax=Winogradskyella eckloniae TaxID=1089306 RepID=UPI0015644003|nr:GTPase [Winogradskyella eckloniae]NRD21261.1 GTPase [Winogradskyella eckloniae]
MKLLFIYNANSGKLNALFDIGHKLISPSTYACSLCALTHDVFKENTQWKNFKANSGYEMAFFHKDEFESNFPNVKVLYPTVLKLNEKGVSTVLSADVLNQISNVDELIGQLDQRL